MDFTKSELGRQLFKAEDQKVSQPKIKKKIIRKKAAAAPAMKPTETAAMLDKSEIAMCEPFFLDTRIQNNDWMTAENPEDLKIDHPKAMRQFDICRMLFSVESRVYLEPPMPNLQDQPYISNQGVLLPHLTKGDKRVIVLANFKAEGRGGEEDVLKKMLEEYGFTCVRPPKGTFEGEAEMKNLRDNIYIAGWGMRSSLKAYQWMADNLGCQILLVKETDKKLYHFDCSCLPLDSENVLLSVQTIDEKEIQLIEKYANIIPVTKQDAYEGLCNSVLLNKTLFNASRIEILKKGTDEYDKEWHKNNSLEKICSKYGLELMFVNIDEFEKSGASLSCMVLHLTPNTIKTWSEPWVSSK